MCKKELEQRGEEKRRRKEPHVLSPRLRFPGSPILLPEDLRISGSFLER